MRRFCTPVLFLLMGCTQTAPNAVTPATPADPGGTDARDPVAGAPASTEPGLTDDRIPDPGEPARPGPRAHNRCGWIGGGDVAGEQSFIANAAHFTYVHPKWWSLEPDGVTVRKAGNHNDPAVLAAAKQHEVRVMPLVDSDSVSRIRLMINDPAKRAAHVKVLVGLVAENGYAGLDVDYEHLWDAADRAGFSAFATELGEAMHAAGFELSFALPGIGHDGTNNGFDYAVIAAAADTIHIMGYDYHYLSGSHLGPLAPNGWIDAVFARAERLGVAHKLILGLANYAIGKGYFTTIRDALGKCTQALQVTTTHMASCPLDRYDAGRAPHCMSSRGELWMEDLASMEEKIVTAKKHGASGVTYWTIGDELPGYFALVEKHFP